MEHATTAQRTPDHLIEPLFHRRWSPRAFDGADLPMDALCAMFEAARWAPSAFNIQPWRFLYARRDDAHWQTFLGLLDPFNAAWAQHAAALVVVLSDTLTPGGGGREPRELRSHSFDTGAAWAQFALQATALGYHAHAMGGVEFARARRELRVPERYRIEIAVAIGTRADPATLPEELQVRETPSGRRAVDAIAFAGSFPS